MTTGSGSSPYGRTEDLAGPLGDLSRQPVTYRKLGEKPPPTYLCHLCSTGAIISKTVHGQHGERKVTHLTKEGNAALGSSNVPDVNEVRRAGTAGPKRVKYVANVTLSPTHRSSVPCTRSHGSI